MAGLKLVFQMYPDARPKARDVPPTTVRLDPDLRARLAREATIAGVSLTDEISRRLRDSFGPVAGTRVSATSAQMAEPAPAWAAGAGAAVLDESQRLLLRLFAQLSVEKQMAVLALLDR